MRSALNLRNFLLSISAALGIFCLPTQASLFDCSTAILALSVHTREQNHEFRHGGLKQLLLTFKNDPQFEPWLQATQPSSRDAKEILASYQKHRESGQPIPPPRKARTVDLSANPLLAEKNEALCAVCTFLSDRGIYPRIYSGRVMGLKAGDTVVFGERSFKLTKFLGRGNAAHVWEIEGRDDVVLRIPFYSAPQEGSPYVDTATFSAFGPKAARMFMAMYVGASKTVPKEVPRVKVLEHDEKEYSWALVTKLRPKLDGRQFLEEDFPANSTDPERIARRAQLLSYIQILLRDRHIRYPKLAGRFDPTSWEVILEEARQFGLEGPDWVLQDWDN
jgi:hypothetical protein